ncbi:MAG: bacteriohemerythrin [Methylovulum sp.]|nr:MAG: bacteriohemerythrin [Methylovulum sp.]
MHKHNEKSILFILLGFTLTLLALAFAAMALIFKEFILSEFLAAAMPVASIALFAAYGLAHKINRDIAGIHQAINTLTLTATDIANGDFNKRVSAADEQTKSIADVFNTVVDRIAAVIQQVMQSAINVTQASEKLKQSSATIADSANDVECRLALTATSSEHIAFNANTMAVSIEEASGNVSTVSASVYQLSTNINTVAASAEEASTNMVGINHSFDRISQDINTVANSAEKMSVSMSEIAKNAQNAMRISGDATASAQKTLMTMNQLSETAKKIGRVVKLIDSIAGQTNMLALNATIEAASAGDAGKGFAVVAGEIKDLAQQTAEANNEIADQIEQIQSYAAQALDHTQAVNTVINQVAEINQAIDLSVEQQSSSADTITAAVEGIANASKESVLNLQEATKGLKEITRSAAEASQASRSSARALEEAATGVKEAAHSSTEVSTNIKKVNDNIHSVRFTLGKMTQEIALSHQNAGELSLLAQRLVECVNAFNFKESHTENPVYLTNRSTESSASALMPQVNRVETAKTLPNSDETPLIVWDLAVYSVGIREIDRQHSILVELINRLAYGLKHKISRETMEDVVNYLVDYTVFHFGYEEKLLAEHNWPELAQHKAIHEAFVNKVKGYQRRLKTDDVLDIAEDIMAFLKDWLLDHILKTDKQYGIALNAKGIY